MVTLDHIGMHVESCGFYQRIEGFDILVPFRDEERIDLPAQSCAITDIGEFAANNHRKTEISMPDDGRCFPNSTGFRFHFHPRQSVQLVFFVESRSLLEGPVQASDRDTPHRHRTGLSGLEWHDGERTRQRKSAD